MASYGKVSAITAREACPFPAGGALPGRMQRRKSVRCAASGTSNWLASRATGLPEDALAGLSNRTGMLGNASVASVACDMPASPAYALVPPVTDDSHRRRPKTTDAKGRRRDSVFKRSSVVGTEVGKLTAHRDSDKGCPTPAREALLMQYGFPQPRGFMRRCFFCPTVAFVFFAAIAGAQGNSRPDDWAAVTTAIGRSGTVQSDGVMKYGFPRSDLKVTLGGVRISPTLALGSWVAFKKTGTNEAMVMGDLVLAETEEPAVVSALQQKNVQPTAVHNHLLRESPRVVYVHIAAHGDAVAIATAIRAALDLTKTPPPEPPGARTSLDLDTALIHRTLGYGGKVNGGVYQVSVPRREAITMDGEVVPPSMGVSTAINFQPTGRGWAAITGDFVMVSTEVSRIIPILRSNQIDVTAIHSHMLGEEPRLYFMHFWADADAGKLSTALRRALDQMK